MTADELATLAKVERLLAGDDVRDAVAAELERGDRCGVGPLSKGEYRDDAVAILSIVREHVRGRGLLAEPQVNPSEAKAMNGFSDFAEPYCAGWNRHAEHGDSSPEEFTRLLMDAFENSGPERARRLVDQMRAGLLAEGEESQESCEECGVPKGSPHDQWCETR
jgi:hypothetical protein